MTETPFSGTVAIVGRPGVVVTDCAIFPSFTAIDERVCKETCAVFHLHTE
ncbi:hypothetical protein KRIGEM_03349 [Komagataeibacter rhaeticus]|nr:hypothetical protein KRIGEM_03349 [Komagataeibacter rhaeticus]